MAGSRVSSRDKITKLITTIAGLVPAQAIYVEYFEDEYPKLQEDAQPVVDKLVCKILAWYHASIVMLQTEVEAEGRRLQRGVNEICKLQARIGGLEQELAESRRESAEFKRESAEFKRESAKFKRENVDLGNQIKRLQVLQKTPDPLLNEKEISPPRCGWGIVTRANAWRELECQGTVTDSVLDGFQQAAPGSPQYRSRISRLGTIFPSISSVLNVGKNHAVLQVGQPPLRSTSLPTIRGTPQVKTRRQKKKKSTVPTPERQGWRPPKRFHDDETFALKVGFHPDMKLNNEIRFLKEIRDSNCFHLPELVWLPAGERQLGIVPVGRPITFGGPDFISRRIITGLLDGLKHLHELKIIHRDIRPSNLVLDNNNNVIIIDYETSVKDGDRNVSYEGGYVCWPKRLLESNKDQYDPEPEDDLLASVLVALHLLFPSRFNEFRAAGVGLCGPGEPQSKETQQLLGLWKNLKSSMIWGPFVHAAENKNYDVLKGMADIFYHV